MNKAFTCTLLLLASAGLSQAQLAKKMIERYAPSGLEHTMTPGPVTLEQKDSPLFADSNSVTTLAISSLRFGRVDESNEALSIILLTNKSNRTTGAQLDFFAEDGSAAVVPLSNGSSATRASSASAALNPGQSAMVVLYPDREHPMATVHARLTMSVRGAIHASGFVGLTESGVSRITGIPVSTVDSTHVMISSVVTSDSYLGAILHNFGARPQTYTLRAADYTGKVGCTAYVTIPPRGFRDLNMVENLPCLSANDGISVVHIDSDLANQAGIGVAGYMVVNGHFAFMMPAFD